MMGHSRIPFKPAFSSGIETVVFTANTKFGRTMLWTVVAILLILWLLGFSLHVAGGLIHILLVVAVIVFIINVLGGRRG